MIGGRRLLPQEQNGRKLVAAIQSRDESGALALISGGGNVEWCTLVAGTTPLHAAAEQGFDQLVARLIEAGAKAGVADKAGWTALHFACDKGHAAMASSLVAHGAECNARNLAGWTPLLLACEKGRESAALVLLGAQASPNIANRMGQTPLHYAYAGAQWRLALELLARGARSSDVRRDVPSAIEGLEGARLRQRLTHLAEETEKRAVDAAAYKSFVAKRAASGAGNGNVRSPTLPRRASERDEILATERALRSLLGCDMAATLAAQTLESIYQRSYSSSTATSTATAASSSSSSGGAYGAYGSASSKYSSTGGCGAPPSAAADSSSACSSYASKAEPVAAAQLRAAYPQYAAAGSAYAYARAPVAAPASAPGGCSGYGYGHAAAPATGGSAYGYSAPPAAAAPTTQPTQSRYVSASTSASASASAYGYSAPLAAAAPMPSRYASRSGSGSASASASTSTANSSSPPVAEEAVIESLAEDITAVLQRMQIPSAEIMLGDIVGKGNFGHVVRAAWRGRDVCVKVLSPAASTKQAAGPPARINFGRGARRAPRPSALLLAQDVMQRKSAAAASSASTLREAETLGIVSQVYIHFISVISYD